MTRRKIREYIFRMLFREEFHEKKDMPEQLKMFSWEVENGRIPESEDSIFDELEAPKLPEDADPEDPEVKAFRRDLEYIQEKCRKIEELLPEIDAKINDVTTGWKTGRMNKVDLAILRLAVYEISYEEEMPEKVAINEAVELAKKYGSEDSGSFVNGVLSRYMKACDHA